VETLIENAEAGIEMNSFADGSQLISLRGEIAALRAYLAMIRHHFKEAIELSRQAQELLGESEARWRSFVEINLAGAYRFTNAWAAAGQTYLKASELSRAAGDRVNALVALSMRGEVLEAQGQLHQSAQQFEQVLQLAQQLEILTAPATGYALIGLGRIWFEWNDLQTSFRYVQEGIQRAKKGDIQDLLLRGYLALARLRQAQDDWKGTQDALENAEQAAQQMGVPEIKDWVNAFRAQTWLAQNEVEAAAGCVSTYSGKPDDTAFPTIAIALARLRLAQGKPDEALEFLEHALQSAYTVGRLGNAIEILVVKALVHQEQEDLENAFNALSKAVSLAEPEGYLRAFLNEGEPMRSLISIFRSYIANRSSERVADGTKKIIVYIHKLLNGFSSSSITPSHKDLQTSLPEPLSERELEVLRLMAAGLSNRDIADRDIVSINTVKTQVKSIYGKLGTHTREDAIAAARELGLV
jgi:LuxR family maltose regulon positive regulatory protein